MSLMVVPNSWGWQLDGETSTDTPNLSSGVGLARGASDGSTKGAWNNISLGTTLAQSSMLTRVQYGSNNAAATAVAGCMDIGVDPAGGTSYSVLASNIIVGQNAPRLEGSIGIVELPLLIPAGASVAARISSNRGATALESVYANFFGQPSRPEQVWVGSFCESVGVPSDGSVPSGNLGASFTPGNSGSWGSWATVGTTVRVLRFWQLYVAVNNATQANLSYYFQLAYGDGTNYVTIIPRLFAYTSTAEKIYFFKFTRSAHVSVPSGSTIYVRGVCSGTADTGWNAMALGVG